MKMAGSVFNLPRELQLEIVAWLDVDALKEFSICSKACRELVNPLLYRSIRLSPTRLALGIDSVDGIARYPRQLALDDMSDTYRLREPFAAIPLFQALESRLHLFSNVTSLKIRYTTAADIELNLHTAFSPKLWASSIWSNLKKISLILNSSDEPVHMDGDLWVEFKYANLSKSQRNYLGEKIVARNDWRGVELKLPPNVEDATIRVGMFSLQKPWAGYCVGYFYRLYYLSLACVGEKLRKLEINAGLFCPLRSSGDHGENIPSRWDIEVCPGITHLKFRTGFFKPSDLDNIADRFPGLEELEVSQNYGPGAVGLWPADEAVYPRIQKLKQLRRAALPWPVYANILPAIPNDDHEPASFATLERLESSMDIWTSNGMEKLDRVVFGAYGAHVTSYQSDYDFAGYEAASYWQMLNSRGQPTAPVPILVTLIKTENGWANTARRKTS
ncbi:hypothetical protein TWF281_000444 [Arthrobotrys megalospora]